MSDTKLPKRQYWSFLRMLKQSDINVVKQVRVVTWETLKRLGAKRNEAKAPPGIPRGSDHVDVGALVDWLRRVDPEDKGAVAQVVALDAVCTQRVVG